jgi:inorganic pyrophosphatase
MDYWHDVDSGNIPDKINVIVEIPKGSQNKYEYDKKNKIMKLDRVLFSPMHYPGDYGIIPKTLAKDGDPLDALVMVSYPSYPGILIEARPVGVLKLIDNGSEDDKILCVPLHDIRSSEIKDKKDMQEHVLNEISHFFETYKKLEGKKVKIIGWFGAKEAKKVILESKKAYLSMKK